jgi:hypothetical protein
MVSQAEAVRKVVESLELGPEHGALVAYCEGLAEQIDKHPDRASLWREYRPAVEALLVAGEVDEDDGQATFLQLVRTPVVDAKDSGSGDAGAGTRGGGGDAGPAADAVATAGR